jgi:hypothetical protein
VKVTTQLPGLSVLSLEPDFAQTLREAFATLKVTFARGETIRTPTRAAKGLIANLVLALRVLAARSAAAAWAIKSTVGTSTEGSAAGGVTTTGAADVRTAATFSDHNPKALSP